MNPRKRVRTASDRWKNVIHRAVEGENYENGIDVDSVLTAALAEGVEIARESVRVKLHRYSSRGYMKKIGRGKYALTREGIRFFKLELSEPQPISALKKGNPVWDNLSRRISEKKPFS